MWEITLTSASASISWWHILLSSLGSVTVLFIMTKLMGKRQISQLTLFDYINGITIGSIAAELASMANDTFWRPLIALVIFSLAEIVIAFVSTKSITFRKAVEGSPLILFDNEKFYKSNMTKAKLDINEFLSALRYEGYFDLADVHTAVFETSGMISVLPKSTSRPATPEDLGLSPAQDKMVSNVIIDGHILPNILKPTGNDEQWVHRQLEAQNIKLENCILGTVDGDNVFTSYERAEDEKNKKNPFI